MKEPSCQQRRVILTHSDSAILQSVRRGLRDHGYDVRTTTDRYAALDLVRSWLPQAVLAEFPCSSPAINEFCARLKAEAGPQILAILGDRPGQLRMAALAAGVDDYIVPPLTMPELLARVKLAMARFDQKDRTARRIETSDLLIDLD